jgi:hypothetical protein
VNDEKTWLRLWTDELYLWYREVPAVDPAQYATPVDYFHVLKTPGTTASGKPKDQFHFIYPTEAWEAFSQSGLELGYGVQWVAVRNTPPRQLVAAYTQPSSPAAEAAVARGAQVLQVDGVDLVNDDTVSGIDTLNAGLSPSAAGEPHTFLIQDVGSSTPRTVTLTSANIVSVPVQGVESLPTATGKVGYMLFNDHLGTAEVALVEAIEALRLEGVTDLVLDLRYNGGGYLAIASELAYMIAGPAATAGETFEKIVFNDKHPTTDPVTGDTLAPMPFIDTALGYSAQAGQALPHLDLARLLVITGSGTCSASESVINGLRGVDVEVIQIGAVTCGKPYGFYPQDNCGTTYFSIQFQGLNAKEFGDYPDGFAPGETGPAGLAGCLVADDFAHALGDPAEARLDAALTYLSTGACTTAGAAARSDAASPIPPVEGQLPRPPWRENRILGR